jgi:hypothetical protein
MVERSPFFFGSLDRSSGSSSPYTGYLPSGIEYYIPPSLRRPVLEAGRMGYEVLDNIFGFDDDRVTAGEELGRALREDPLGVGEAVAGGIYGAVKDPIGTGRAVIEDIGGSFSRIQDMPDPRYATREEMGQGAADLFATAPFLSAPVVAGRLGLRGLESVLPGEDVVTSVRENPTALAALADRMREETTALGLEMLQDDGMLRVPVTRNGEPAYIEVDHLTYRSPYGAQFFGSDATLRDNLDQFADILEMGLSTEDLEGALRNTFFDRGLGADMFSEFSEFDQQVPNELRQFSPDILRALFQQRASPSPDELAAFDRAMAGARLDIRDADDQIANQLQLFMNESPDRVELRALLADRLVDDPTRDPTNPWRDVLDAEHMREQVDAEFAAEQARIVDILEQLDLGAGPFGNPGPFGYTDEEIGRFLEEFRPPVADFDEFPDDDIDMSVYSQGPYNQYQYDLTETYLSDSLGPAQTALAGQTKFNSVEELLSALKSKRAKPAELALRGITPQGLGAFVDADGKIDLTDARVEALLAKNPVKVHVKTGADAAYERNFTPGGQSYSETILTLENPDLGNRSSVGGLEGAMSHFGSVQDGGPSIVHFRTAEFPVVEGGTSFHLGEIQSDVAQTLRQMKKRRAVQQDLLQDLLDVEDTDERLQFFEDNYMSFSGGDFFELHESLEAYLDLSKKQREALIQGGLNSDDRLWDSVDIKHWQPEGFLRGDDISDPVERARVVQQRLERNKQDSFYLKEKIFRDVMGILDVISDLERSGFPKTNVEKAGLQGLYTTEKTTDLAIKSAFDQIMANPRVTHFTLGTGRMAHDMTGGTLEGQQAFYDGIAPKQVNKVLEQLEKTSGLDMPRLDFVTIRGDAGEYKVPAFEITDNFRNAIREYGLPMFRKGGRVVAPSFLGLGSLGREYL